MNGAQPFVYLSASSTPKERENDKGRAKVAIMDPSDADLELCLQCRKTNDVVLLKLSQGEADAMREAMDRKRLLGPVKKLKSSKKRKNDSSTDDVEHPTKKWAAVGPRTKISAASQAAVSGLAMEEAKRKSEMSDGAKSLYGNGRSGKDTFTTMGTLQFRIRRRPSTFYIYCVTQPIQSNPRRFTYIFLSAQHHQKTNCLTKQPTKPPPFSADGPRRRCPKLHDLRLARAETAEIVSG